MPEPPLEPTTVSVHTLIEGVVLPSQCDPLTKLIAAFECIGGQWQMVLIDSEQFISWLGIDPGARMKGITAKPCGDCGSGEDKPATSLE